MKAVSKRALAGFALFALTSTASAEASAPAGRYMTSAGLVVDTKTRLTWQRVAPSTQYSFSDANSYCATAGATLGGTGWRLPTMKELLTLVDPSRSNPSIDPTAFPGTPADFFWTSSHYAGGASFRWVVLFDFGYTVGGDPTSDLAGVRCVR